MAKNWNTRAEWITTEGGGPLPFTIPDRTKIGSEDGRPFELTKSYTKSGTKYVRVHVFETGEVTCPLCDHKQPSKMKLVEVNTYATRRIHEAKEHG